MHGILKLHVFVWRIRLRILLQPDDQVGGGFRVYWEVTAFRLLITVPGTVDEVAHELFRSFLLLRKAPDRGTIGDMGHCGYSHAVPSEQWRLAPFFFCCFTGFVVVRDAQAAAARADRAVLG